MRMFMYPNKQTRQCFPVLLYESSGTTNDQMFMCHVLGIGLSGTAVKTSRKANITFQGNHNHTVTLNIGFVKVIAINKAISFICIHGYYLLSIVFYAEKFKQCM